MEVMTEFENLCKMLLEGVPCFEKMDDISVEVENLFYENFGLSSEDIRREFCRHEGRER